MSYSIRMTAEERNIAESYAKLHSISLAEAFKNALFEKIEDEYDLKVFAKYEKEKASGKLVTRPIKELWEELEI